MPTDAPSPFSPGQPVHVELFIGRQAEIEHLMRSVQSAASGRLQVVFMVGERGIGKSSLASFVGHLSANRHKMLCLHTFLGGVKSLEEVVHRVLDRFDKVSANEPWYERITKLRGKHISKVGLFGVSVEFQGQQSEVRSLVTDFAGHLRSLLERIKDERTGLLVVLDDINGLAESLEFANWLKSLVDEVATSGISFPVCLLLVGVEERRQQLIESQRSLDRVLDLLEIRAWTTDETSKFFNDTFGSAGITVDDDAMRFLVACTGGLPVLAHEVGDAGFRRDTDSKIDRIEAIEAGIEAAENIGRKLLQPEVFSAIRSNRYRSILTKLSDQPMEMRFRRAGVMTQLSQEEGKVFDNFLQNMSKLGVVELDKEEGAGAYRFTQLLYQLYVWLEALAAKRKAASDATAPHG